jgi:peptide/nickel transport system substrate-binding protein
MSSNEVDYVHGHQDQVTINALTTSDGILAANFPEAGLNYFMINTKKSPTDDVHIRRALSYATDYEQMRSIYGDMPEASGPVPPSVFGHSDAFEAFTYDLEKAKAEIAASKYADNLAEYPISLDYIQGNGDTGKLIYLLGSALEGLGFTVAINETPWVQFCNNEAEIDTSPNVTNLFATAPYSEAGSILEFKYASWSTGNWNQNEWLLDDNFDSMLRESLSIVDQEDRVAKYAEIQQYLVEDVVPSIYTFVSVIRPVYNSNVFEWRGTPGNKYHAALEYNFYYLEFVMK